MRLTNLHKVCLSIALLNAGDGLISTVLPPFLEGAGYALGSIGLIVAIFSILSLVSRMPAGLMYKPRYGNAMIRLFSAAHALSLPLYSLLNDATGITLVRAFSGFTFGAATTLNMAIFMGVVSSTSNRARATAFYAAAMSCGFAVGNSFGGWLVDTLGYGWTFELAAILPGIAAILSISVPSEKQVAKEEPVRQRARFIDLRSTLQYAWSAPVLVIALLAFTLNANHYLMNTFFPLYATAIGINLTSVGFLRGFHSLSGMITRPFSGEATRFVSNELLANVGLLLAGLLVVVTPSFDSMVVFLPIFIVMGMARGFVMVSNQISLAEETRDDARKRGVLSGVFNMSKDLGNVFGPIFGGVLASYTGIENMLRIGPIALLTVYFVALGLVSRRRAIRRSAEAVEVRTDLP